MPTYFPAREPSLVEWGKTLYESNDIAKDLFEQANDILGFRISDLMFSGTDADLKQTNVTQPAVFLHSVVAFKTLPAPVPEMVAGHSWENSQH
jgi:[acyl-carrier-protein] S-malonyltransferase